jgi:ATP-dependent protease HslVU (ClpYQ) peptidase subunit
MTVVAGLLDSKGIYIGSDTFGSNGWTGRSYKTKKVFKKNNFIIGGCGSYRMLNLLKEKLVIPSEKVDQNIEDYIYNDFCNSVIDLFKKNNFLARIDSVDRIKNASFIFAYKNRLFSFQTDLSILESKSNYIACGSGEFHAEASLFSTENTKLDGEERLRRAIICANNFVISVNDDIQIEQFIFDNNKKLDKT